jgi:hypothetical protein
LSKTNTTLPHSSRLEPWCNSFWASTTVSPPARKWKLLHKTSSIASWNLLDRNYTAMRTHMRRSVHLSALLIRWVTWGDG